MKCPCSFFCWPQLQVDPQLEEVFKKGSKTYFYSSLFFPTEIRQKINILYAFVRTADDLVDSIPVDKLGFWQFKNYYLNQKNTQKNTQKNSENAFVTNFLQSNSPKNSKFSRETVENQNLENQNLENKIEFTVENIEMENSETEKKPKTVFVRQQENRFKDRGQRLSTIWMPIRIKKLWWKVRVYSN